MNELSQKIELEAHSDLLKAFDSLDKHIQDQASSSENLLKSIESQIVEVQTLLDKGNKKQNIRENQGVDIQTELKKTNLRLDSIENELQVTKKEVLKRMDSIVGQLEQLVDLFKMVAANLSK